MKGTLGRLSSLSETGLWCDDKQNNGGYLIKFFRKLPSLSRLPVQLLGRLTQLVLELMGDKNSAHTHKQ